MNPGEMKPLFHPITMSDIRLCAGEGKFTAGQMLDACNAVLRSRATDRIIDVTDELLATLREEKEMRSALTALLERWEARLREIKGGGLMSATERGCLQYVITELRAVIGEGGGEGDENKIK